MKGESKSWNISKGVSIYLRKDSPRYYGCLRINGKYYRKSLDTQDHGEAISIVLEWNEQKNFEISESLKENKQNLKKLNTDYKLDDKYSLDKGRVFLTGTQALVRLPIIQRKIDQGNGINTACYISGYTGSPLGGYDHALNQASDFLDANEIVFQPGINEDLAATALHGSQQTTLVDKPKYDGVFGIWYGKGPGVDRSGDALKHGNYAGTSKYGGVLALAGDDHGAKSSTTAHQSDHAFIHFGMPILNPATVQDYLDFGVLGFAMSRYSGCWVGFKCVTDTVESAASVDISLDRFKPVIPEEDLIRDENIHIQWGFAPAASEPRLYKTRLPAAQAFARANSIDKVIFKDRKKLAIITSGKAYLDVRQALDELGLDEDKCKKIGVSLYKVGMVWPLEDKKILDFVEGHKEVLIIEEKRSIIEDQLIKYLYNKKNRPVIVGKKDENGHYLVPSEGELSPSLVALIIAKRISNLSLNIDLSQQILQIEDFMQSISQSPPSNLFRLPSFCAGCPHNTSTKVPEDSFAFGGIGCHGMATFMPERQTYNLGQMGGEGVMWTGIAPFTETDHIFQNLGDGTYYHSGILALRSAVASGANITYKILVNDAIAMTGGQEITGKVRIDDLTWQVHAEGAKKVVVVTDYPEKYPKNVSFAPGVEVFQRDKLDDIQKNLRQIKGVTVILYDQYCATELRRRRKRGLAEEPNKKIFINPLICEGCGDCGAESNCIAIEPLETKFGRKRQINQSACNKDFSCTKGYCPSFLTITGGELKKKSNSSDGYSDNTEIRLPKPIVPQLDQPFNILITGIGGSGVITLGAILGTAAHLEGKGSSTLDVAGLAQRNGPVTSHLRVANSPSDLHATRIASGSADLIIGCDIVVTTGIEAMSKINSDKTNMVINNHVAPTSSFASDPNLDLSSARMIKGLKDAGSEDLIHFINATKLATSLIGNAIGANLFLVGYAIQKGLFPISLQAVERAIELNGVSIQSNKESIYWGRLAAIDIKKVEQVAYSKIDIDQDSETETLDSIIQERSIFLTSYQDVKYAEKYNTFINTINEVDKSIPNARNDLSIAVARYYFKLMSYKDEYEVARLHTGKEIKEYLTDKLEGNYKIEYSLAPPIFGGRNKNTGKYPKRKLPSLTYHFFNILKHFKFLRGTSFDIFGLSKHRKIERDLIYEYEQMILNILDKTTKDNYDIALKIASYPEEIKGYDVVKDKNIEKAKILKDKYMNEFNGNTINIVNKYPIAAGE